MDMLEEFSESESERASSGFTPANSDAEGVEPRGVATVLDAGELLEFEPSFDNRAGDLPAPRMHLGGEPFAPLTATYAPAELDLGNLRAPSIRVASQRFSRAATASSASS